MKLPFRQGIVDAQKNGLGQAQFLLPSGTPGFVSLAATLTQLTITVAHGTSDYLVTFNQNVGAAWGPVTPGVNNYLYWNIDLASAAISYGITTLEPVASPTAPPSPAQDQHWFDLNTTTMKFWNGVKWLTCVRLFAGMIPSGNLNSNQTAWCYPIYQAWLNAPQLQVETTAGYIATNIFGVPARMPNMEFLTSKTPVRFNTTTGTSGVLSQPTSAIFPVRASENIPAMSVVFISGENTVGLASGNPAVQPPKIPMGVVQCALIPGEVGVVHQSGEISCDTWDWSAHIGRPLYCGDNGEFLTTRPNGILAYRVGVVKNRNTIIFHVDAETLPQIYEVSGSDVIINGAAPLSSTLTVTGLGEKIWDISIPPATTTQAGYMTTAQATELVSLDTRLDQAELDIAGRALLVHSHAISAVTGLQAALDGKSNLGHTHTEYAPIGHTHTEYAPIGHTHTIVDVSGLQVELNSKAPLAHMHVVADVTGLQPALDGKVDKVPTATVGNFASFTADGGIEDSTVSLTSLSSTFAFANHTHSISNVTGLQTALDGKAPLAHVHTLAGLTDVAVSSINAGQVLTYDGSQWVNEDPPSGGGGGGTPEVFVWRLQNIGQGGSFSGNLFSAWLDERIDQTNSTNVTFDSYTSEFIFAQPGLWQIEIFGKISTDGIDQIPDGLTSYGIEIIANNTAITLSSERVLTTRYTDPNGGIPNGRVAFNFGGTSELVNSQFIQGTFLIGTNFGGTVSVYAVAHAYDAPSVPANTDIRVVLRRVADYSVS